MKIAVLLLTILCLAGCGKFFDPPNYAETAAVEALPV